MYGSMENFFHSIKEIFILFHTLTIPYSILEFSFQSVPFHNMPCPAKGGYTVLQYKLPKGDLEEVVIGYPHLYRLIS